MIINCLNKNTKDLNAQGIKAKLFEYEITEQDMNLLSQQIPLEYEVKRFFIHNNGIYELIADNIENGRVVVGGLIDNKYILTYYIVEEGLNTLLMLLEMNGKF